MIFPIKTELEYIFRVILAVICGAAIGFERESRLKTAGIRTHIIVSLGSSIMMIISKYGFGDVLQLGHVNLDPSRVAAGIVTAVGFIGAGVIFVKNQNVSGVTTAAGIWATVGIGMAIGSGMYILGSVTTVVLVLLQFILHRNHKWLKPSTSINLTLAIEHNQSAIDLIHEMLPDKRVKIMDISAKKIESDDADLEVNVTILISNSYTTNEILTIFQNAPHIKSFDFQMN